jgi:predicted acetyltransferase
MGAVTARDLRYGMPNRAQAETFVNMSGQAFAFDPTQWLGSLGDHGWENMRTLTDEREAVIGGLVIHATGQWFGGRRLGSHAISAVVAAPEARRIRVGQALMLHGLREARAAKVPLSVLYASAPAFYRGVGYEPAGEHVLWRAPAHELPTDTGGASFVQFDATHQQPARDVYERFARERSGLLDRTDHFWRAHFDPYDGARRYAYRIDFGGEPEGYLSLQHARPQNTLFVQDAIATTPRAARALLAFLSHHRSVVDAVVFPDGPAGPLHRQIANNRARPEPPWQQWMVRLTDVQLALEQRGYAPVDATFQLDVLDTALPENAGRYVLKLRDGSAQVSRGGEGRIRLDVRALTALFTSFSHPRDLVATGLLSAERGELELLGAAFAGPRPYLLDTF